ncbi:hypothetical protein ACPOL_2541 [Acidisarcina polymorpha]|uniref:Uncharacterized protein n=1 Tax=Acidisarcina polymorpha TaxID=2211140 RepID=A0A2Z5FYC1_9BACT|nr:hypothetical protein [Acidisarcina polymorpha]AXC11861.1 hypothetical protein ACPOL_2541 [Acidisarcina polymorpha]
MESTEIAIRQAELVLKLYELRREPVMRLARSYVGGEFLPSSADELTGLVAAGNQQSAYILQVYGYWDMVAAFVLHGAIDESLLYDVCPEMYFQFAKIQPHLSGFRDKMGLPEWMKSLENVVDGSLEGRSRLAHMRHNLEEIRAHRSQVPRE